MATIGIKIANGDFYPLLGENDPQKKKFALIPARKGQTWAHIDFYKSESRVMEDAQRIGRLSLGNGTREMDEDDVIDLDIEANGQGKINAIAKNVKTDERRELVIWLNAVDKAGGRESADEKIETPEIIGDNAGLLLMDFSYERQSAKKFPLVPVCVAALSLAAACCLFLFFLPRGKTPASEKTPAVAPAELPPVAEPPAVAYAEEPPEQERALAEPPPVAEPPAAAYAEEPPEQEFAQPEQKQRRPPAPVRSYKAPKPIPKNGTTYKVRWGDTLWDITDVFYNNPWLYIRLARYNKLRPYAILLPGVVVRIPPKL
ncbi:MAG: hypothetical protein LBB48_04170 [Treponema sp.]|jgi:nucleoid-associated protein YgaU|nr:hypothetical protein [Treponema sp.]